MSKTEKLKRIILKLILSKNEKFKRIMIILSIIPQNDKFLLSFVTLSFLL